MLLPLNSDEMLAQANEVARAIGAEYVVTYRPKRPLAEAKPGDSGYFPMNLTPGKYIYACFLPEGGKKNGKPHYKLGMEGSFTVS